MTKVKICGLSRIEDIEYCNELLPDYIGFILGFPKSKRNVSFEQAKLLKSKLNSSIKSVGVFVNADIDYICSLCDANVIDYVQLHGNEDDDYISKLKSKEDILSAETLNCDYLLLDTYVKDAIGGSGIAFDWSIIPNISKPYFLAGGLNANNVSKAIAMCNPYAVDVSSSVEDGAYKSKQKIAEFISAVKI